MSEARAPAFPDRDEDRAVWLLSFGQFLAYACLLYAFPALLVAIEADTGWSKAALALGPTLALVAAAVTAPLFGRLVDRGWGGETLVGSAIVGAAGLLIVAGARGQAGWLTGWIIAGFAQGAGFYDTCFSFLTRRLGPRARAAIIRVTLVAGFAVSFTFPLGALAGEVVGWRAAFVGFALLFALVGGALNAQGARLLRRGVRAGGLAHADPPGLLRRALGKGAFWVMAALFTFVYFAHGMVTTFAIPLFQAQGAGHAAAVLAATLIGPAQVAGRAFFMGWGNRMSLIAATRIIMFTMLAGDLILGLAGISWPFIFLFTLLQGATIGIVSILRPILVADVLGNQGFGVIAGALAIGVLAGSAAAPWIGALILEGFGPGALIAAAVVSVAGAGALALLLRRA